MDGKRAGEDARVSGTRRIFEPEDLNPKKRDRREPQGTAAAKIVGNLLSLRCRGGS
jgi:hypothetical protein